MPKILPDKVQICIRLLRRYLIYWSVQRPILTMSLVIMSCVAILPLVTITALMPIAILLKYYGLLASQGIQFLVYDIIIQGLVIGTVIVALFISGFAVATSASVLHSYNFFTRAFKLGNNRSK